MIGITVQLVIITGKYRQMLKYCALWSFPPRNTAAKQKAMPLPPMTIGRCAAAAADGQRPNAAAEACSIGADVRS